jgi:radical SAM superfamily enzyme YgiQ (UPF0313 family)
VKVTFLSLRADEPLAYGLMVLAATLRQRGHEVALVQGNDLATVANAEKTRTADVLAMSATTGLHRIYLAWTRHLRAAFPDKLIVMGGPHPTFFPQVVGQAPLDGVCVGEGEESFPEFLDFASSGFPRVPAGWWIRRERGRGPVEQGMERGPVRDLDALPSPALTSSTTPIPATGRSPTSLSWPRGGAPIAARTASTGISTNETAASGRSCARAIPSGCATTF